MKVFIKRILGLSYYLYARIFKLDEYKVNMGYWFFKNGNDTLLTNHYLNNDSIVVDVGGYTGFFSDLIIEKYNPHIYIFEPVKEYYDCLVEKYKGNSKVRILKYGLSSKDTTTQISLDADKTSLYKESDTHLKINLRDVVKALDENGLTEVDLISINIEGGEYDLLERLIDSGYIKRFKFIQVQFHKFVKGAEHKRKTIVAKLKKNFGSAFSLPFVWEGFSRNDQKLIPGDFKKLRSFPEGQYRHDVFEKLNFPFIKGKSIIDVGCGSGINSLVFRDFYNLNVVSTDIYKHANIEKFSLDFKLTSVEKLDYPDESFDYVFAQDVLHHIDETNQDFAVHEKALREMKRVVKKSGYIVFVEANRFNPMFYPHMVLMLGHDHFSQKYFMKLVKSVFNRPKFSFYEAHYYNSRIEWLWKLFEHIMELISPKSFLAYNIAIVNMENE